MTSIKEKNLWIRIKEWWNRNPDEIEEEKEFERYLEKVEKRIEKINIAKNAKTYGDRIQTCMMVENAYTQRKISEANKNLQNATWLLALATGILAYATIMSSPDQELIMGKLQGIVVILMVIILIGITTSIVYKIIKFIGILLIKLCKLR
ncbi:hypothetical protein FJZ19_04045 [Candidatus Pacearchaeota archaeon]|nr:hypothetical protein [Candidatus Pacearchaeota archaeon]